MQQTGVVEQNMNNQAEPRNQKGKQELKSEGQLDQIRECHQRDSHIEQKWRLRQNFINEKIFKKCLPAKQNKNPQRKLKKEIEFLIKNETWTYCTSK